MQKKISARVEKESKKLSASISLGESVSLYDGPTGKRLNISDLGAHSSYKISETFSIAAALVGSVDHGDSENNDLDLATLRVSHSGYAHKNAFSNLSYVTFAPSVQISLPVSKLQRQQSFLAGLNMGLDAQLGEGLIASKKLNMGVSISMTRNFFTYEQGQDGTSNSQYWSIQGFYLKYNFSDAVLFSFSVKHLNSWTFLGTPGESYNHTEEISYKFNSTFSAALGHQLGIPFANVYKSDGNTLNLNLLSVPESLAYVNTTICF